VDPSYHIEEVDQVAAVTHTQFLPTLEAAVSLEEEADHYSWEEAAGHTDLLPTCLEEAVDHNIDLRPYLKLVVVPS
jgi:hypothetical protein